MFTEFHRAQAAARLDDLCTKLEIKRISKYVDRDSALKFKCLVCSERFTRTNALIRKRGGCPTCRNLSKHTTAKINYTKSSTERVIEELKKFNGAISIRWDSYVSRSDYATFDCICGNSWSQVVKITMGSKYGCKKCATKNTAQAALKLGLAEAKLKAIGLGYKVIDKTIPEHRNSKLDVRCLKCKTVWAATYRSIGYSGGGRTGCPTCRIETIKSSAKRRPRETSVGSRTVTTEGYEHFAAKHLIKVEKIDPRLLKFKIAGIHYEYGGKSKRYYPDISIGNLMIEVKSLVTAGLLNTDRYGTLDILKAKRKACTDNGFSFRLMIMNSKGALIKIPTNWYRYSKNGLNRFIHENNIAAYI